MKNLGAGVVGKGKNEQPKQMVLMTSLVNGIEISEDCPLCPDLLLNFAKCSEQ